MGLRTSAISKVSVSGRKGKKDLAANFRDGEDIEREYVEEVEEDDEGDFNDLPVGRYLSVNIIRTDGGTQSRDGLDPETIKDYAEKMLAGDRFPALTVFYDGEIYWLADGFHRLDAAMLAQIDLIECTVRQGTRRDAVLYSVSANGKHGLPRTNDDKRRAVQTLLDDAEWSRWSNRQIAKQCDVSPGLVDKMRNAEVEKLQTSLPTEGSERTYINKHGQEATMQTGNIGKSDAEPVELKVGMYVRQMQSGQSGPIVSISGARIAVQTANGARIYDRSKLEVIDTPDIPQAYTDMQADRIKTHWGSGSDGKSLLRQVEYLGFSEATLLKALQPDAKQLTDLNMTADEAASRLNQIAQARTSELFPADSIVKSKNGDFWKIVKTGPVWIEVNLLLTGARNTFSYRDLTVSSQEEFERTPKKHWADQNGKDFEEYVASLGFGVAEALELIQPGAQSVRDLKGAYYDARTRINNIVRERVQAQYPVDGIIKTANGHFGKIKYLLTSGVSIDNFSTGDYDHLAFSEVTLSSLEEYEAAIAAAPLSGYERFDDYTAETIQAVMPALRRVLDWVQGLGSHLTLGKDIEQLQEFLSDAGDIPEADEDPETDDLDDEFDPNLELRDDQANYEGDEE